MCSVIRKIREFNSPDDCQFDLFDKIVVPDMKFGAKKT